MIGSEALFDAATRRAIERLAFALRRQALGHGRGSRRAASGPGWSLRDYRVYSPGDDVRSIDWATYARLQQLYVRRTDAPGEHHVSLIVDESASMDFGVPSRVLQARRLATLLAAMALWGDEPAEILRLGAGLEPERRRFEGGKAALPALFEAWAPLTRAESPAVTPLFSAHGGPGASAVLITDAHDAALCRRFAGQARRARRRALVICLRVPLAQVLPDDRGEALRLHDAESGESLDLEAFHDLPARVEARLRHQETLLERQVRSRGGEWLALDSARAISADLIRRLRATRWLESRKSDRAFR